MYDSILSPGFAGFGVLHLSGYPIFIVLNCFAKGEGFGCNVIIFYCSFLKVKHYCDSSYDASVQNMYSFSRFAQSHLWPSNLIR